MIAHCGQIYKSRYLMVSTITTASTSTSAEFEYPGTPEAVYSGVTVNVTPYEPRELVPLSELEEGLPREDLFYTGPSPDQVSKGRHSSRVPLMRSEWNRHPRIKRSSAKG